MRHYRPQAGGYGAFRMVEDNEGEWVKREDVDNLLAGVLPGKFATVYRCAECNELHDDVETPCVPGPGEPLTLYCPECWEECNDAAEESSLAYFNRYIAGDR